MFLENCKIQSLLRKTTVVITQYFRFFPPLIFVAQFLLVFSERNFIRFCSS